MITNPLPIILLHKEICGGGLLIKREDNRSPKIFSLLELCISLTKIYYYGL
jgi:hypothetical protein